MVGSVPPPFHGQSIAFKSALDALQDCDIFVVEASFRSGGVVGSVIKIISYFIRVFYGVAIFRPKVVYFLCSRSAIGSFRDIYLLALTYFFPIKVFNHLHGSDFRDMFLSSPKWKRWLMRKLYSKVCKHVVLVEGMQEQFQCLYLPLETIVIPNYYSREANKYFPSKNPSSKNLSIVYLSSIIKSKGILELIEAVDILMDNDCDVKLRVAGGFLGDDEMSAKEIKKEFYRSISGKNYIDYLGVISAGEKFKLLARSQVFVLPSYYVSEAIPLSIIEAMRMGCYVIVSNYKYLPSLVEDQVNGSLVQIRNPEDIHSKIKCVYDNRNLLERVGLNNIRYSAENFSEDSYQQNIRNLLLG